MFPKNLTITVEPYTPTVTKYKDETPAWGPPQDVEVYGFGDSGADQEIRSTKTGLKIDGDVYTDTWPYPPKSKVTVDGVTYQQVGRPENYNLGPFGYTPGVRVNLSSVEG